MCVTLFTTTVTVAWKKVKSGGGFIIDNTLALPLEGFMAGCIAGIMGKGLVVLSNPEHALTPLGQMIKNGGGSSATILYRFSPYWGLRMAIYSNSIPHYGATNPDKHPILMTPYYAATGAWTEMWMRAITNPFHKVRYSRDLAKRSTVGQLKHIWTESGALGFFNDTFKYRVEVPKMGAFFGTYHSLRNTILQLCADDVASAPLPVKAVVDLLCGGVAAAAAGVVSHGISSNVYGADTVFAKRTQAQVLKTDVPVAAVAMCMYGIIMHFIQSDTMIDGGLSGWIAEEEFHTGYGGNKMRSLSVTESL